MKLTMASSPHSHSHKSLTRLMLCVIAACIPGLIAQIIFFGTGVLIQLILALIAVSVFEAAVMLLRKRPVWPALSDGSAWLSAVLLALSIPPLAPWWIVIIGCLFAIVIVKQLYGGLGFNLFNPAMAAYVLLLISFPVQMTAWMPITELLNTPIGFTEQLRVVFTDFTATGFSLDQVRAGIDGITMATPLDTIKTDIAHGLTVTESMQKPIFNEWAGHGWVWVNLGFLAGGLYLLKEKIINWHIPVSFIASLALCSGIGYIAAPGTEPGIIFHLLSGATMMAAFFIATDPVSAATTNKGRLIYGAAIGLLVYLIRTFGGFPDAVAFSVLLLNIAVPLIDYYTQPRTYGHGAAK
ncbi:MULTISPECIES: electron transport complex subunit RsxD [Pseudoalteromonas]|nr:MULTISPECIES: electron transport complex subunit RsxD [Pseudoalteromonas]MBH0073423.1 electron transport complex subunit RsxD [Pseudoalteromonas sp. NZS127]MBH0094520.1 electron transport complex subunit RsxD [Pseudoalteromonas sp. SCQQ13]MBO7926957.1 electron transport complex subunit RsxD [Pseudoalteromonas sp. K222D]MBB1404119.1 electron transport complex subunit RsxD [Pseudoalteromonas sp. SG44-5]MBE0421450.1 electron transport complex subunit RsxD [Pseudoalteromonas nigrifaciens]